MRQNKEKDLTTRKQKDEEYEEKKYSIKKQDRGGGECRTTSAKSQTCKGRKRKKYTTEHSYTEQERSAIRRLMN